MESKFSFKDVFLCSNYDCRAILNITDDIFDMYFNSKLFSCPSCKNQLNLWETVKKQFELTMFGWHYSLLGCQFNLIEIILKLNEVYTIDFSKEVGEGKVLYINYSPSNDGLFPLQIHSNVPIMHFIPKIIKLYPRPLRKDCKNTKVQIYYWFAPKKVYDNLSVMLLLDAFQKYYDQEYRHMAISAQSAIEIMQYSFFKQMLETSDIHEERVRNFLEERASFSPQLFTLLPFLAKKLDFVMLSSEIIEGLKLLIRYRNDMIHRGKTKSHFNKAQYENMLLSSFFTVKYYSIIHGVQPS